MDSFNDLLESIHSEETKKAEFEHLVKSYSGDDPLKPWYDYIQWSEQSFPKHGREGNLKVLLENFLTQFKDLKQYYQDVRFIDVWTIYAAFADDPLQMYKQIHDKGIGSECAIFYLCWAQEYEKVMDMKCADQVFIEGIQRKAKPLEDLITAHINFQIRVARNFLGENPVINQEVSVEQTALSTLRALAQKQNLIDSTGVGNGMKHTTAGVLRPSLRLPLGERKCGNVQKTRTAVYSDEHVPITDPITKPEVESLISLSQQGANKENTLKTGHWNEGKVKKSASPAVLTPSALLGNPVLEGKPTEFPKTSRKDIVSSYVLKTRNVYEDEKEIPVAIFEPYDPSKRPMYPKSKVYSGGTEFSLEELRATLYFLGEAEGKKDCGNTEKLADGFDMACENHKSAVHVEKKTNILFDTDEEIKTMQVGIGIAADAQRSANRKHVVSQPFGFEVILESEEEMNTELKLESKPSLVQKDNKVIQQFKEDPASRYLQVPSTLKRRKESLIQANDTFHNGPLFVQKECDQSLTVNTKAVINAVKDMWSSPPPAEKNVAREPVVSKFGKNCETVQHTTDVVTTPFIPFKIFSDTSVLESEQFNGADVHTSDCSKQDQVGSRRMLSYDNCSDQKCAGISVNEKQIDVSDAMKRVDVFHDTAKYVGADGFSKSVLLDQKGNILSKNIASRNCEPVEYPPIPAKDSAVRFSLKEVPIASSPETSSQLAATSDDNTEDKENMLMGNSEKKSLGCRGKNNVLQPSKDIYFVPLEQQIKEEEQQRQNHVLSDETCCTEVFAVPLVSSTPIVHPPVKGSTVHKQRNDESDDNTFGITDWIIRNTQNSAETFIIDNKASKFSKGLFEARKELDVQYARNVPSAKLNTVGELSKQNKCSSTGTSDGSSGYKSRGMDIVHWCAPNKKLFAASSDSSQTIAEELENDYYFSEGEKCSNSSILPFYSNQLRENWLIEIGFPSEVNRHRCKQINEQWDVKIEKHGSLRFGEKNFSVLKILSEENSLKIVASQGGSKHLKMLELKNNSFLWEQYIREEIKMRLKNLSMAKHFDLIEEMYLFSNKHIVIPAASLLKDLKDLQEEEMNWKCGSKYKSLFIAQEILKILAYLHQCQIVHGNLSVVSFKFAVGDTSHLVLSGFEKAVDLTLIPENTVFDVAGNDKYSILNASLVSPFQVDYIAVAGVLHSVIFGESLKVKKERGMWMTELPFPRGFEEHVWQAVFKELLNNSKVDLFHLNELVKFTLKSGK